MFENFEKLVKTRQSCRDFSDKPVEKEKILKLAKLAMLAPSACNSQPWKMYCVTDMDKVKAVTKCLQEKGRNTFLSGAKAYIAVSEKQATLKPDVEKIFDGYHFVKYDVGELIAYLTLGAKALGLETCIIGWINHEALREELEMPENEACNVVIAFGYSDIPVRDKARKAEELIIKEI